MFFCCFFNYTIGCTNLFPPSSKTNKKRVFSATSPSGSMDIGAVNDLSYEEFVDVFGNVVERCPVVAAAVWPRRPFRDVGELEAAINHFIDALPQSGTHPVGFI